PCAGDELVGAAGGDVEVLLFGLALTAGEGAGGFWLAETLMVERAVGQELVEVEGPAGAFDEAAALGVEARARVPGDENEPGLEFAGGEFGLGLLDGKASAGDEHQELEPLLVPLEAGAGADGVLAGAER